MFEKPTAKRVMTFLEREPILTDNQRGSPNTAVLYLTDLINSKWNDSLLVIGVCWNIKNAYDSVHYRIFYSAIRNDMVSVVSCLNSFKVTLVGESSLFLYLNIQCFRNGYSLGVCCMARLFFGCMQTILLLFWNVLQQWCVIQQLYGTALILHISRLLRLLQWLIAKRTSNLR